MRKRKRGRAAELGVTLGDHPASRNPARILSEAWRPGQSPASARSAQPERRARAPGNFGPARFQRINHVENPLRRLGARIYSKRNPISKEGWGFSRSEHNGDKDPPRIRPDLSQRGLPLCLHVRAWGAFGTDQDQERAGIFECAFHLFTPPLARLQILEASPRCDAALFERARKAFSKRLGVSCIRNEDSRLRH